MPMKNKISNRRGQSQFSSQRSQGIGPDNLLEVLMPDSKLERTKAELEDILRWEDDGGQNPMSLKL
jgi:hypothetical protein